MCRIISWAGRISVTVNSCHVTSLFALSPALMNYAKLQLSFYAGLVGLVSEYFFNLKMILRGFETFFLWKKIKFINSLTKWHQIKQYFSDHNLGKKRCLEFAFSVSLKMKKHGKTSANASLCYFQFCCPYYSLLLVGKSGIGL